MLRAVRYVVRIESHPRRPNAHCMQTCLEATTFVGQPCSGQALSVSLPLAVTAKPWARRGLRLSTHYYSSIAQLPPLRSGLGPKLRRRDVAGPTQGWYEVNELLETALPSSSRTDETASSLERRLEAVQTLGKIALPSQLQTPGAQMAAEGALHRVLRLAQGEYATALRSAAEKALWEAWHRTGDEDIDATLRQGTALMEKEHLQEAERLFSGLLERDPGIAEAWNKRATVRFLRGNLDGAIADCDMVLKLKPKHFGCLSGLGMCHQARGDGVQALRRFREALRVNPGMEGPLKPIIERLHAQTIINEQLRPYIVRVAQALGQREIGSSGVENEELQGSARDGELCCDWEVYRVASLARATYLTYLFRVRIWRPHNASDSQVKSLARFYALRFEGGRIVPLTRLTEGPASFSLCPGEDYRFCFQCTVGHQLLDVAGGVLVERVKNRPRRRARGRRFLRADLVFREPSEAAPDEVERLKLGYTYTGALDLQRLDLGSPVASGQG